MWSSNILIETKTELWPRSHDCPPRAKSNALPFSCHRRHLGHVTNGLCSSWYACASRQSCMGATFAVRIYVNEALFYKLADIVTLISDWADVQADLELHCPHSYSGETMVPWQDWPHLRDYDIDIYAGTLSHLVNYFKCCTGKWGLWNTRTAKLEKDYLDHPCSLSRRYTVSWYLNTTLG